MQLSRRFAPAGAALARAALLAVLSALPVATLAQIILPPLGFRPPVGGSNGSSLMWIQASTIATAIGTESGIIAADTDSGGYPLTYFAQKRGSPALPVIGGAEDATATAAGGTATAVAKGQISTGSLHALAIASGGGTTGFLESRGKINVGFIDLVTVLPYTDNEPGEPVTPNLLTTFKPGFEVHGAVTAPAGSSASAVARMWIFGESALTAASGSFFFGHLYQDVTWSAVQGKDPVIDSHSIGAAGDLLIRTGTRFWVVGSLELDVSRAADPFNISDLPFVVATADFQNTMNVYFEPTDANPDFRVVSVATGREYVKPVPEPSTLLLSCCGSALVLSCSGHLRRRFARMASNPWARQIG